MTKCDSHRLTSHRTGSELREAPLGRALIELVLSESTTHKILGYLWPIYA